MAKQEKVTVYKAWHNGSCIISNDIGHLIRNLEGEVEYHFENSDAKFDFEIEKTTMPVEEYENLPEFEGFC